MRLRSTIFVLAIALLLCGVPLARAQMAGPASIAAQDAGSCATATACVSFGLGDNVALTIDISGAFTGTLTFESSVNGIDWRSLQVLRTTDLALVTTTTAAGSFTVPNVGFQLVRIRAGTFTPGTAAVIYGRRGYASALKLPLPVFYTLIVPSTNTGFIVAATDADVVIATLPPKTFVLHVLADLTTPFHCAGTCTSGTLSLYVGKTAGGNQYLLSFDADAAAAQFGDAANELGASIAPATVATMIGDLGAWAGNTSMTMRLHSATGNLGTGTATHLDAGSVTFYVTAVRYP